MIKIIRPVTVKMILTEKSREELKDEFQDSIHRLKMELEQLHFQKKKLLSDALKKGNEARKIVEERIEKEEQMRKQKIEQIELQLQQVDRLPLGSEIVKGTVESSVTVREGDNWDDIMARTEIVIRDGIVESIRNPAEMEES
ncbi:MAG: YlqD family protein [Bacillaceae bacterium]|nr:YlqD family protein [Bacillaceae bacterium]